MQNIWGLCSSFVEYEPFLESSSLDILALCKTNVDESIGFEKLCLRGFLPLIWKDFFTHMHGLAIYMKEGLHFAQDLTLEKNMESYLCFWLALLHSVSYFFYLYWSPLSLWIAFSSILSNIDQVLLINPSTNVCWSLETLMVILRTD